MNAQPLGGYRIVSLESRMSEIARRMIEQEGGRVLAAPSMQEVPLEKNQAVFDFGRGLLDGEIDILLCMTGVGVRMLFEILETRYERAALLGELRKTRVVARGPKPVGELRKLGVPVTAVVPEPNTWRQVVDVFERNAELAPLRGKVLALQEYGETNEALMDELTRRGADLRRVPIYRWEFPEDTGPLEEAVTEIIAGRTDAVLFTSGRQISHLLTLAGRMGREHRLREALNTVPVGSIGPVCTEALASQGVRVDFQPGRPKLASLVRETAAQLPSLRGRKERYSGVRGPGIEPPGGGKRLD